MGIATSKVVVVKDGLLESYAFQPPTYMSGPGRHDESTEYIIPNECSFDEGAQVKNTASGGIMTIQRASNDRGPSFGWAIRTQVLDGTGTLVAVMEMADKDETAEEVHIFGVKPFLPHQQPAETGYYLWAKVIIKQETKATVVQMTNHNKDEFVVVRTRNGSFALLHQGKADQPVLLLNDNDNSKYSIAPKADPIFMLCVVSSLERIQRSRQENNRMKCCYS